MTKYRNTRCTTADGVFDSRKELKRWGELQLLVRAGEINRLQRQVEFRIIINSKLVCKYVSDFVYYEGTRMVVEDVKSPVTRKNPAYRIKLKLMDAVHGISIRES